MRDSVADSLLRLFGEERPVFRGLNEEEMIERIAIRVVARLGATLKPQANGGQRYVRESEAASFLGVSVFTLRAWRSRGGPCSGTLERSTLLRPLNERRYQEAGAQFPLWDHAGGVMSEGLLRRRRGQ